MKKCPCGTNLQYDECCGQYIKQGKLAATPESLMRSRYSAYVENEFDYILKTMTGPALLAYNRNSSQDTDIQWLGLNVLHAAIDIKNPAIGYVEFIAKFEYPHGQSAMHEKSIFHLIDGVWYYVDGKHNNNG